MGRGQWRVTPGASGWESDPAAGAEAAKVNPKVRLPWPPVIPGASSTDPMTCVWKTATLSSRWWHFVSNTLRCLLDPWWTHCP